MKMGVYPTFLKLFLVDNSTHHTTLMMETDGVSEALDTNPFTEVITLNDLWKCVSQLILSVWVCRILIHGSRHIGFMRIY
jgi:hypothetical protein